MGWLSEDKRPSVKGSDMESTGDAVGSAVEVGELLVLGKDADLVLASGVGNRSHSHFET